MKKIKFIIVLLAGLFMIPLFAQAQSTNDEVTLVVSADGATKEEATQKALINAIEQTYGTFVSANTSIIDDNLVKDEIATVSSGNIKKYKEISCENMPTGNVFITLETTVSINNLADYAKSKGAETEFAGNAFAMNFKLWEFNKKNEEKALVNLLNEMYELYKTGFDYTLNVGNPTSEGVVKCIVKADLNKNGNTAENIFFSTIESISLSEKEISEYKNANVDTYPVYITSGKRTFVLRSQNSVNMIKRFFTFSYPKALLDFTIDTGVSKSSINLTCFSIISDNDPNGQTKYDNDDRNLGTKLFQRFIECGYYGNALGLMFIYNADTRKMNQIVGCDDSGAARVLKYDEGIKDAPYAIKKRIMSKDSSISENTAIDVYPQKKHEIAFCMRIPMDEMMKISKITITPNN